MNPAIFSGEETRDNIVLELSEWGDMPPGTRTICYMMYLMLKITNFRMFSTNFRRRQIFCHTIFFFLLENMVLRKMRYGEKCNKKTFFVILTVIFYKFPDGFSGGKCIVVEL